MSAEPPRNNELLEAADLSASKAGSVYKRSKGLKPFLLWLLLLLWSFVVYHYFSRNAVDPEAPEIPAGAAVTPVPEIQIKQTPAPTPQPASTPHIPQRMMKIQSRPPGATVLLENQIAGQTPFDLENPRAGQSLLFQLHGYESRRISIEDIHLESGLLADLQPILAKVHLEIYPKESVVHLDGEIIRLQADGILNLPVRSHELKVSATGYKSETLHFTPAESYERKIRVELSPVSVPTPAVESASVVNEPEIVSIEGLEMILAPVPLEAELGSARGTAGRQSNEVQLKVKLSRPFRISKTEISNAQFRKFKPGHNSGRWKGVDLNADPLPVTGVTWEDAVEYCNWLSRQAGLPPAYIQKDERWEFQEKPGTGYRLPTEAEWESLARLEVKQSLFGWGDNMPPTDMSVNIAGKESAKQFANTLQEYSDRFAGPAPVEQAGEGPLKLKGLYGNVSEWVQDGYSIPPLSAKRVENPLNSAAGKFHVIKGASWQDAGIADLRIARRRYGEQSAVDLGFRVAGTLSSSTGTTP